MSVIVTDVAPASGGGKLGKYHQRACQQEGRIIKCLRDWPYDGVASLAAPEHREILPPPAAAVLISRRRNVEVRAAAPT